MRYKNNEKSIITYLSTLVITSTCVTSAFASESSNNLYSRPGTNEVIDATTGRPNEFTKFEHTPVMLTNAADIPVEMPTGNIIEDNPTDKMQTLSRANPSAVYGPYTTLSLSDDKMQVIVYGLKTGGPLSAVSYNNKNCFKFTYGGNTIYVTTATFFKTQSASLSASLSSAISNNINTSNSNYVYSTAFKSYQYTYNGMTVYRWSFARIGVRAFQYSNAEMVASCKIDTAYDFDVYQYSIQDIGTTSSMVISPTLSVANTGSNSLYFGGYKLTGTGNTCSSTDISTIINLGYKTAQAVGAVASGLSFSSFYGLYQTTVGIIKSASGGRWTYISDITPLSSGNKYSYSCSTASPFNIWLTNDLYTLSIGFIGTKTSTTNFSGSFSCIIS